MGNDMWFAAYEEYLEEHPDDEDGAIKYAEGWFERAVDQADAQRKAIRENQK